MPQRHTNLDLNAKWTAQQPLLGWRHFRIVMRRYEGDLLMIELMAACDKSARLWVEAPRLKDREQFVPGWTHFKPASPPAGS